MFAILHESGVLVLKLPPARVAELIAEKASDPWYPRTGVPLKEYVAVGFDRRPRLLAFARCRAGAWPQNPEQGRASNADGRAPRGVVP